MLISRGCSWASMKRGAVNLEMAKPGAVLCQKKRGGVVSQLVPKLKESVPPPPPRGAERPVVRLPRPGGRPCPTTSPSHTLTDTTWPIES